MLQQKYNNQRSEIASYSYTDIAEGTGVINFYPYQCKVSGATTYGMSNDLKYSGTIVNYITNGNETKDYDVTFNMPKTLKGKSYLSYSLGTTNGAQAWIKATLSKVSGGSAVEIANASSVQLVDNLCRSDLLLIDTSSNLITFRAGDSLRLTIYLNATTGGAQYGGYGVDPMDRADDTGLALIDAPYTTRMVLSVPFTLDTA